MSDAVVGGRNWRRVAVAGVVILAVVLGVGVWYWRAHRTGVRFAAMFTSSVGVYPGSDVRILGVPVGKVDSVTPEGTLVKVDMHLDPDVSAAADTAAVIISPNLVSDRYVQLTGVWTSGPKLGNGTVLAPSRTRTPVELDDLYRSLLKLTDALGPNGANSSGALNRVLRTGAANLGGNGAAINTTIRQLSAASVTLAGSKDHIFGTIANLSRFTGMLKTNNSALVQVNSQLSSVTQTLADDRQSFGAALHQLGTALSLVQNFVRDNRDALSSNVAKLNRVARTLAQERGSLLKALGAAPLLVQNFVNAYDAKNNVLRGRVNLNELTIWQKQVASSIAHESASVSGSAATSGASTSSSVATSSGTSSVPGLLPATNVTTGGGS